MQKWKIIAVSLSTDRRIVRLIYCRNRHSQNERICLNHSLQSARNAVNWLTLTYNLKGVLRVKTKFLFVCHHLTQILYALQSFLYKMRTASGPERHIHLPQRQRLHVQFFRKILSGLTHVALFLYCLFNTFWFYVYSGNIPPNRYTPYATGSPCGACPNSCDSTYSALCGKKVF